MNQKYALSYLLCLLSLYRAEKYTNMSRPKNEKDIGLCRETF